MNATLLEYPDRTVCPSQREVELSALVEKLLGEVSQLRGEVAGLRQQVGYWKAMFEQAKATGTPTATVPARNEPSWAATGRAPACVPTQA